MLKAPYLPQIDDYEIPDLRVIALCVNNNDIGRIDGDVTEINVTGAISEFYTDFCVFVKLLKEWRKIPQGYVLHVPDFWHIAFGRARCMPKEEGEILWEAAGVARQLGKELGAVTEIRSS